MGTDTRPLIKRLRKAIKPCYSRVLRLWHENEVIVLIVLGASALLSGLLGYSEYFSQYGNTDLSPPYSYVESLYRAALLFKASISISGPLNSWIEAARWIALVLLFYAVLKGVLGLSYKQTSMQYLKWFVKGHVIIAGFTEESILLAKDFIKNDKNVVIVDNTVSKADQHKCRELGIILVDKDPTEKDALQKAQVQKASYIVNIMENDGRNVEASINAYQLKSKSKSVSSLSCFTHISDRHLENLLELQQSDVDTSLFTFEYFNIYENAAMALLNRHPVYIDKFTGSDRSPHVLIVGSDKLSESLIIHSVRTWLPHYLKKNAKMKITLVAGKATLTIKSLTARNPKITELCDFNTISLDFNKSGLQQFYLSWIAEKKKVKMEDITSAYVCLNDDAASLSAALSLCERLKSPDITIVACTYRDSGLASLLRWDRKKESRMKNLYAFGIIDNACRSDIIVGGWKNKLEMSVIPQAMYEYYVNRQIQSGSLDASSAVTWNSLSEEEKEKNRRSANSIADRLAYAGYEIAPLDDRHHEFLKIPGEDIEKMAQWEHQRWYNELTDAGWTLGPKKDPNKKTNPNLWLWKDLLPEIKQYNLNAAAETQMFLFEIGFQIIKKKNDDRIYSEQSPLLTVRTN